jgi:hypothetical protein
MKWFLIGWTVVVLVYALMLILTHDFAQVAPVIHHIQPVPPCSAVSGTDYTNCTFAVQDL